MQAGGREGGRAFFLIASAKGGLRACDFVNRRPKPARKHSAGRGAYQKKAAKKAPGDVVCVHFLSVSARLAVAKSVSGAMKQSSAARSEQAPSAVCCLFRDCCAILGLLRSPTPDAKLSAPEMTTACRRQCCASSIANHQKSSDRVYSNPGFLWFWRISGALFAIMQSTGGSNKDRPINKHRQVKVFAQLFFRKRVLLPNQSLRINLNARSTSM